MIQLEGIPQALEMIKHISELDSIRKTAPNLSKVLEQIKETISNSHNEETKLLNKEIANSNK